MDLKNLTKCVSQYFPETMVVFTTTVSGIIKQTWIWGWAAVLEETDGSPVRHQTSTSANRLCVGLPTGSVPSQTRTFSTAAAAIFLKISPQNNLLQRGDREEAKVVPCNRSVTFLAQFRPVLFCLICLMCLHSTVMKYLSLTSNHNYVPLNSYYTGYHFA